MTSRDRFIAVMESQSVDRVPNHDVGGWELTIERWKQEGLDITQFHA